MSAYIAQQGVSTQEITQVNYIRNRMICKQEIMKQIVRGGTYDENQNQKSCRYDSYT